MHLFDFSTFPIKYIKREMTREYINYSISQRKFAAKRIKRIENAI